MTISFKATAETVARGRTTKPIPPDVMAAVNEAIKTKSNVVATVSTTEAKSLVAGFNRLRKNDESYHFTLSQRPGEKEGTVRILLADVSKDA